MAHQFVREPLRAEEADRLANACEIAEEKLIVWTSLDTGLRVSELCSLPWVRAASNLGWLTAGYGLRHVLLMLIRE